MSALFSTPKMPKVQTPDPAPPAPTRSAEDTANLAAQQRESFFRRGGRGSTMLTGGSGTGGGVSAIRFLGGAART
jgi:hypothetical protein